MNPAAILSHFPKMTLRRYRGLRQIFSDWQEIAKANSETLINLGWKRETADDFLIWREEIEPEKIMETMEKQNIHCLEIENEKYPPLLRQIADPPFCIFTRGELPPPDAPFLSIVGTRRATRYGLQMTEKISSELASRGVVIVSGLAVGIDTMAHASCLSASGKTIAVLGGGIDEQSLYPASNKILAEKIISQEGALVSEYPPGFMPTAYSFPRRNRLIAGLSSGTLVIEGKIDSGAMITARCALDYDREVMALPQNANSPTASGPHDLIKQGARLVTCAEDIIDALNLQNLLKSDNIAAETKKTLVQGDEEIVLNLLSQESKHIDQIIKESGLASQKVGSTLLFLEMKGRVRNLGNMCFSLR